MYYIELRDKVFYYKGIRLRKYVNNLLSVSLFTVLRLSVGLSVSKVEVFQLVD